ncbi:hypothetical protein FIBSPDRAFT_897074 [Athelia psychrophila]|uniref:HMG box domain-containing protein n=1 Tax=Athelia psychrophila TaxID=1759441 RepID=A0A166CL47_9AGAM|nr:hypothetical protein FIBSPDRAFT_897074 [Fibularhizoctonia sp. CBS 109695]
MSSQPSEHILEMPSGWAYEQDVQTTDDPITGEIITFSIAEEPLVPEKKIKRPPNRFILFRGDFKERYLLGLPEGSKKTTAAEMSRMAGEAWRNLPREQKNYWAGRADSRKDEHARDHPGYQYKPERKPKVARRSHSNPGPFSGSEMTPSPSEPKSRELPHTLAKSLDREGKRRAARMARRTVSYSAPTSNGLLTRESSPVASLPESSDSESMLPNAAHLWSPSSIGGTSSSAWDGYSSFDSSFSEPSSSSELPWIHSFEADVPHLALDNRSIASSSPEAFLERESPVLSPLDAIPCFWEGVDSSTRQSEHEEFMGIDPSTIFISNDLLDSLSRFEQVAWLTNTPSIFDSGVQGQQGIGYGVEGGCVADSLTIFGMNDMRYDSSRGCSDSAASYPSPPSSECPSDWARRYSVDSWVSE